MMKEGNQNDYTTYQSIILSEKDLYLFTKIFNDLKLKNYYKVIHKTLSVTIKETKILYYNTQITTSENKTKTTWNIVQSIISKKTIREEIDTL